MYKFVDHTYILQTATAARATAMLCLANDGSSGSTLILADHQLLIDIQPSTYRIIASRCRIVL